MNPERDIAEDVLMILLVYQRAVGSLEDRERDAREVAELLDRLGEIPARELLEFVAPGRRWRS